MLTHSCARMKYLFLKLIVLESKNKIKNLKYEDSSMQISDNEYITSNKTNTEPK
jgi:hypothetical protein